MTAADYENRTTFAILSLWLVLILFPVSPLPPAPGGIGLGPSWVYGINLGHKLGMSFGSTLVFTYGPLGFLLHPDPTAVDAFTYFLFAFGFYAVLLYSFWALVRSQPSLFLALFSYFLLASFELFSLRDTAVQIECFLGLSAAILLRRDWAITELLLAALCTAFLLLAKFSDGLPLYVSFCVLVAWKTYSLRAGWRRHRLFVVGVSILPLACLVAGLLIQGGGWQAVIGYIRGSLQLGTGYNQVMGLPGPRWQPILGILGASILFVLLPLISRGRKALIAALAAAAPLGCLFFKHAMVRAADHASAYHITLASVALLPLVCARYKRDRIVLLSFCVVNVAIGVAVIGVQVPGMLAFAVYRIELKQSPHDIWSVWHAEKFWTEFRSSTESLLKPRLVDSAIAAVVGKGSVDIVPMDEDFVRANHWFWRPRPVFQSFVAYTPYLDELNASYFSRPDAARHILVEWTDIDGRLPFLDDATSWRMLIDWYNIEAVRPDFLLLGHRSSPRYRRPIRIGQVAGHWGEALRPPSVATGEVLILRASISQSFAGIAKALVLRTPPVYVEAMSNSGRVVRGRVAWPNLREGGIVNTIPANVKEFSEYLGRAAPGLHDNVESLRFMSPHPDQFSSTIPITWEKVSAIEPFERAYVNPPALDLHTVWLSGQALLRIVGAVAQHSGGTLRVHTQTGDPQLLFRAQYKLSAFKTLVVRARFSVPDRIDLFFARQVGGRGVSGNVPLANRWLDIYINVAANPFWATEAGEVIRFDPASERAIHSDIEIKGIWGSERRLPPDFSSSMTFYFSPDQ